MGEIQINQSMDFQNLLGFFRFSIRRFQYVACILSLVALFVIYTKFSSNKHIQLLSEESDAQSDHAAVNVVDLSQRIAKSRDQLRGYSQIECVESRTVSEIRVSLCIYDAKRDVYVSRSIKRHGVWEPEILLAFMEVLKKVADCLVVDVGANIGQYSLFAAKYGCDVVAVEPFVENILRLHKAANRDRTQNKIIVLRNALSNKRNEVKLLKENSRNVGGQGLDSTADNETTTGKEKYLVETILFDDIVPHLPLIGDETATRRRKAVLKIDIEGFEIYAFQNASKLFERVDFQMVFMEWSFSHPLNKKASPLIHELIEFLHKRKFCPMSISGNFLRISEWRQWPMDIMWSKSKSFDSL